MADTPGLCGEDMRLCPIASGSSGNSIYVGTANTHILVDTGISKKRIEEGLNGLELAGHDIDAILITHEHSDHIQGLGVFTRKYPVPIYGTEKTLMAIQTKYKVIKHNIASLICLILYLNRTTWLTSLCDLKIKISGTVLTVAHLNLHSHSFICQLRHIILVA